MKANIASILLTLGVGVAQAHADVDCAQLSESVRIQVSADKSNVLEIVSKKMSEAPSCGCEVVKSAIGASKADAKTVAAIVEAAITAAPDQSRLISQCAIATAPDAAVEVQMVLAKLDPNSGDTVMSSKSGKDAVAGETATDVFNPLNIPGYLGNSGNTGATPNPGGLPLSSSGLGGQVPVVNPEPTPVTFVNPPVTIVNPPLIFTAND